MSYNYTAERPKLFTEEGQIEFLHVRDKVKNMLAKGTGAFRWQELKSSLQIVIDDWMVLCCLDRLAEIGEIRKIRQPEGTPGQHQIYTGV